MPYIKPELARSPRQHWTLIQVLVDQGQATTVRGSGHSPSVNGRRTTASCQMERNGRSASREPAIARDADLVCFAAGVRRSPDIHRARRQSLAG